MMDLHYVVYEYTEGTGREEIGSFQYAPVVPRVGDYVSLGDSTSAEHDKYKVNQLEFFEENDALWVNLIVTRD